MIHIPVLKEEVLENLNIEEGKNFIDGTFGLGGHSIEIARLGGNVLGIERDPELYKRFQNIELEDYLKERLTVVNDSYINMSEIVKNKEFAPIDGILLDFGMSSWHLDASGRGFTFGGFGADLMTENLEGKWLNIFPMNVPETIKVAVLKDPTVIDGESLVPGSSMLVGEDSKILLNQTDMIVFKIDYDRE